MKRGQVDNAKIISDEIRKRRIGEAEETKTPPVMVTNSMLSEGDIERIISEHTL